MTDLFELIAVFGLGITAGASGTMGLLLKRVHATAAAMQVVYILQQDMSRDTQAAAEGIKAIVATLPQPRKRGRPFGSPEAEALALAKKPRIRKKKQPAPPAAVQSGADSAQSIADPGKPSEPVGNADQMGLAGL